MSCNVMLILQGTIFVKHNVTIFIYLKEACINYVNERGSSLFYPHLYDYKCEWVRENKIQIK